MTKHRKKVKANSRQKKGIVSSSIPSNRLLLLVLVVLVAATYIVSSQFDFVNIDDPELIYENPLVTDGTISFAECFNKNLFNVHYKPMVFLSWKAEYVLFGNSPAHFHVFNVLLHVLNTILLFLIGLPLFKRIFVTNKKAIYSAFGLALIWAINPLRIESVAWATERKDVLFGFFFLGSWLSYLYYLNNKRFSFIVLGAILYLFAGLSKSMALPLIAVLFLMDYFFGKKWSWNNIIEKIPFFIVFIVLSYLYGLIGNIQEALILTTGANIDQDINFSQGYLDEIYPVFQWSVSAVLRFYLWILHTFLPFKLSVVYPYDRIFSFFGKALYLFPMLFIGMLFWLWKKRNVSPYTWVGMVFFVITLSPALAIDNVGNGIFLSDRYTYISSIGLFYILICWLNRFNENRRKLIFGLLTLFFIGLTLANIGHWRNSEQLFKQSLKVDSRSPMGHLNLGNYYLEKGNNQEALRLFNEGIKYNPGYVKLYINRARIYLEQRQIDLALQDLDMCLSLVPNIPEALINRGMAYGMKNELIKSLADLNHALVLQPKNKTALLNRGITHFKRQDYASALVDHREYLKLVPNDEDAMNTIGICLNALKQYDHAILQFNTLITINPKKGVYYYNRALAYYNKGQITYAREDVQKAQELGHQVDQSLLNALK